MIDTIKQWLVEKEYKPLYETIHASDDISQDDKQELLAYILEIATEQVHENIVNKEKADFERESEHFMLRFLYDNAMGAFQAGEFYEARESLGLLSAASNSKHFEKSLHKHIYACIENLDFDTFVQKWVAPVELKHFYISSFSKEFEDTWKDAESLVVMATKRFRKLYT